MLVYSVPDGRKHYGLKRFLSEVYWKVSDPVSSSVSYGTLTFLKTLEGNYATTTPTVLVYSDLDGRNLYGFKPFWRKVLLKNSNQTWSSASCWNWTHVNCLEMCCATTTSRMLLNPDTGKGEHRSCIFFCNESNCKISIKVVASASYGNRTHVNSLESYYATITPTILVYSVPDGRKQYGLKRFLSEVYWKVSDPVSSSVSYGTLTFLKTLEGNYATTTPTVLVYSDLDGRNVYGFKPFWRKVFLIVSNQTWSSASCRK